MIMGEEVEKKRNGGTSFSADSLEDGKGEFHQDEVDDRSGKKKFNMPSDNALGGISSETNVAVAGAFQGGQQITGAYEIEFDSSPVSGQQKHLSISTTARKTKMQCTIELSNLGTGIGSWCDVDSAYSPTLSPRNLTPKAVMPNVSPELLHLVDSAIMGKIESIDKLKNIVSGAEDFGSGQRIDGVSVLVVDSLISTMGGVESFDSDKESNPPRVMLNSRAALIAGELIPWLPWEGDTDILMSPRTRMVRGLLVILRSCTRNRAMCSTSGLLGVLLASAEKVFSHDVGLSKKIIWNGSPLVCCIQYLAGHSVSVTELHKWFQAITRTLTTIWAPRLMTALEKAIGGKESRGPACTFEFDGESSGFIAPGESHWPFNDGFAFSTWLYIETFQDTLNVPTTVMTSKSGKPSAVPAATICSSLTGEGTANMPRLLSFLSDNNQILEAYFHARFLVVENCGENGKKTSAYFTHEFRPQRWYFIGLEYVPKQGLTGRLESEIRLYIDGSLYESHPFWVPHIYRPLAFCCIGTNAPSRLARLQRYRRRCPLFAEIGPIYIFKEPIGPKRMSCLAARGGDAFPSFGIGGGLPWRATNDHTQRVAEESSIFDAEIGGYIHLLYHPTLLNGRICPDASPSAAQGMLQRPAEVLGHVHVATRLRPAEAFWAFAYGGPMSLLPLAVGNVHKDSLEPEQGSSSLSMATTTLAAPIFRILSIAIKHPRNGEELCQTGGPELLARILNYLLKTLSSCNFEKSHSSGHEELVAAIVSLCHSQKDNHTLKVQLFRTLLLDLRIWSLCDYGLQKKLLSSLADMVFTESSVMRDANAIQMLLDGCRRCYWVVREKDSVVTFPFDGGARLIGEVNALVEELLVIIELLMIAAPSSNASTDICCLLAFIADCPQPNQVVGVLHLIYRLVVQPNTTRANLFVEAFLNSAGIETLLVLLQRETKVGDNDLSESETRNGERMSSRKNESDRVLPSNPEERSSEGYEISREADSKYQLTDRDISIGRMPSLERGLSIDRIPSLDKGMPIGRMASLDRDVSFGRMPSLDIGIAIGRMSSVDRGISISRMSSLDRSIAMSRMSSLDRSIAMSWMSSASENSLTKHLGGINLAISADNARNNVYSVDKGDKIVTMIIWLLGALMASGYMKFGYGAARETKNSLLDGQDDNGEGTVSGDKISLLFFTLQRALQAAPNRLLTSNVYLSILGASMNASSKEDGSNIYEPGQCFEHLQLLLVLMRSLPYATGSFQSQVLQDLLFLAASHPENRRILTKMDEWPEWILEVLISNYEIDAENQMNSGNSREIDNLIHNFLIIVLQNSLRQKDGWKDIEAVIHCAEWLSIVGGSSTGDRRIRREESLPIFKRRLFSGLLDFAAGELQAQTHATTAAEGWAEKEAKAEAGDDFSCLSTVLVENAVVVLMLVEDHLRLQGKLSSASQTADVSPSPLTLLSPLHSSSKVPSLSRRESISSDSGEFPPNVLASLSDPNGEISATVVERLTAASAAEPYETVSSAFVSYGSCVMDLAEGWKYRSRLWFGVGLPSSKSAFGGGGSGWDSWSSSLQKDSNGTWIELPLVQQSVDLLHCLLNNSAFCGGVGISEGSSTGLPGNEAMHQLLDSDQPFFCMLRMILLSMREEDNGEKHEPIRNVDPAEMTSERLAYSDRMIMASDNMGRIRRSSRSALLWSVLSPLLNKPVADSKRQRVLVASSVLYSEVWHAVGRDRKPLRKQYLEAILPPFAAVLKRWRPLLAGIHELTTNDGLNPLDVKDWEFFGDVEPIEAAVTMISPAWAAAFASPPAAMALAMIAAGASGMETPAHPMDDQLRYDTSALERKTTLNTFSSFQKAVELPPKTPTHPKDKAAAKAAALAAARDLERTSKIGYGRGLTAVAAMASSSQRRHASDMERVRRWNILEAMGIAWMECQKPIDTKSIYSKDLNALSYKFVTILSASFCSARNVQRLEIDRRTRVDLIAKHRSCVGACAWRRLIHYLIEMKCLFGPSGSKLSCPARVLWKLDTMETSSRMRLCLRRSYKGNDYGFGTKNIVDLTEIKKARESLSSSRPPTVAAEAISEPVVSDDEDHLEINNLSGKGGADQTHDNIQQMPSNPTDKKSLESAESRESQHACEPNLVAVAPCIIPNDLDERIVFEFPSSMVRSLTVVRGTFQVTSLRINFITDNIGNYTAAGNTEGKDELRTNSKVHSWLMSSLRHIYIRRFLLRRSALELFMVDRSNFFFDFGNMENRRNAYRAIIKAEPAHLDKDCLMTQRPEQILKQIHLTERWSRWEISNFEYLMRLNTLAGRTYNDMAQYPIFPWILSDYSSQDINLADPYVYRDLSKPVGALNPSRLIKFKERYANFNEPDIPKYHYDSHYSNSSIVLYYLVRLEPFTSLYIQLQDAKLNHVDQMFSDLSVTWNGVLEDMNDVKELVPELFYLPEVLTNENSVYLGTTHVGKKLESVKLPPWAKDPVDFIHKHRMALEGEHVSAHLHEWIDLIFGYKQQGKEAALANNVFPRVSYEGTVDIDKIQDPVHQHATKYQIAHFGQIPTQLLTAPHMKRRPLSEVLRLQTIFRNPKEIKSYAVPGTEGCNLPASAIHASSDAIIIVDTNAPAAYIARHKWQPCTPDGQGLPFTFLHAKTMASSVSGTFVQMLSFNGSTENDDNDEWVFSRALAFASCRIRSSSIVCITCDKEIITGGHADNSIKLLSSDGAKTLETAQGHCAPISCLALSQDSNYLVTGSRDTTMLLWRILRANASSKANTEPNAPELTKSSDMPNILTEKSRRPRIEGPLCVLRGHQNEILSCCVNSDLGVIVSCAQSSAVLLHSMRRGCLIRQFVGVEATMVCLSSHGVVMTWNEFEHTLSTFTLNGVLIARTESPLLASISCMEISLDGESALVGMTSSKEKNGSCSDNMDLRGSGSDNKLGVSLPSICLLDLHSLQVFHVLKLEEGQDVTALALTKDNKNIIVSTADKELIIFTDPALSQ